ncbi:MAG: hypothetical protein DMG22_10075 [Acidobacteria bacterium]|nr:MAG: hypothetical protein DMG22_10075 [Acidobacteriota bacterium]
MGGLDTEDKHRVGELWALGMVLGYAAANLFDRLAVANRDPEISLVGPLLRGLPSLILGIVLVWKNGTFSQLRRASAGYIGRRAILPFVWAGLASTAGLFAYYFALRMGGVIVTIPVLETYVIWGVLFARLYLGERITRPAFAGFGVLLTGLVALSFGELQVQALSPQWVWAIPLSGFAALTYGISGVFWRDGQLRGAHQSTAILLQFVTSMAVALAVPLFANFSFLARISSRDALTLLVSGILSGVVGIYCMFTALRRMSVARVFAFSGLTPLLATLGAHFLLNEFLNPLILGGIVAISVGVTLTQVFRPSEERQA